MVVNPKNLQWLTQMIKHEIKHNIYISICNFWLSQIALKVETVAYVLMHRYMVI